MALSTVKRAALKAFGISDEEIAALEAVSSATQKSADEAGVAYKSAEPEAPGIQVYYDSTGQPGTIDHNGAWVALKAAAPVAAAEPEVEVELQADDMGDMPMEEDAGGLTLSPEDLTAIGQAVAEVLASALGPLVGAMDMESKMAGHMNELKSMLGGYTAKKDSEAAETRQTLEQLATTVKAQGETLAELNGIQPAATARPTAAASTVVPETDPLVVAARKSAEPDFGPWGDIIQNLGLINRNGNG